MNSNVNFEDIERYLNYEMSGAERKSFEAQLNQTEELRQALEDRTLAHEAIELLIENNLRKQLNALAAKEADESDDVKIISIHKRRRYRQWISIAAGVLLLVGVFAIINNNPSRSGLVNEYYAQPSFNVSRGNVPSGFEQLQEGLKLLRDNKLDNAINIFSAIPSGAEYYITAQYYMAHGLYLKKEYQKASESFLIVSESEDLRYAESADWFGLLSCLQNEENNCEVAYQRIASDPEHSFKSKAEELKSRLQ